MYILFYKINFEFKALFTLRYWTRLITRIVSQSEYYHTDYTLPYKKNTISQAYYPVYRHVYWLNYYKDIGNVDVFAYKVIKKIDVKKLSITQKKLLGRKYDIKGAISSEIRIIKQKRNDEDVFCSEAGIITFQDQGWIFKVKNKNSRSPKKLLKLIIKEKVVDPKRFKIWDGKKRIIINNIFE